MRQIDNNTYAKIMALAGVDTPEALFRALFYQTADVLEAELQRGDIHASTVQQWFRNGTVPDAFYVGRGEHADKTPMLVPSTSYDPDAFRRPRRGRKAK